MSYSDLNRCQVKALSIAHNSHNNMFNNGNNSKCSVFVSFLPSIRCRDENCQPEWDLLFKLSKLWGYHNQEILSLHLQSGSQESHNKYEREKKVKGTLLGIPVRGKYTHKHICLHSFLLRSIGMREYKLANPVHPLSKLMILSLLIFGCHDYYIKPVGYKLQSKYL